MDYKDLLLSRVEVIHKVYDSKNRVVEEVYEYFFPKEKETQIGFKQSKK